MGELRELAPPPPTADATPGGGVQSSLYPVRRIAWLLFGATLCVYLAVLHGRIDAYDTQVMYAVTQNLVDHGSLVTTGTGFVDAFHLSTPYAAYGPAMSVLAAPLYAAAKVVGRPEVLVNLVNPVLTSVTVVLVFRLVLALRQTVLRAVLASVGYGLFTMALWYSTEGFSEPGVALCATALVLGTLRWGQGDRWAPLWVGLAAGGALQFRTDSLVTVWIGLVAVPLFVPWSALWSRRTLILAGGPMLLSLAGFAAYNQLRYHHLFASTYQHGSGSLDGPLLTGLHGLLFGGDAGLFVYNPLTVLGAVGLVVLAVRAPRPALLLGLLIVPRVLFYAKWTGWSGGWVWGPRFLLPVVPLLMAASVELLRVTQGRPWAHRSVVGAAGVLTAVSAALNLLSVRVPVDQWFGVVTTPAGRATFGIGRRPSGWSTTTIAGDLRLLDHQVAAVAPYLWVHGYGALGVVLALLGVAGVGGALWGAQRQPVHGTTARRGKDLEPTPEDQDAPAPAWAADA